MAHLGPLPFSAAAMKEAVLSVSAGPSLPDATREAIDAMASQTCRLRCTDPAATAAELAAGWRAMNRWRGDDPRSRATLVASDAATASALRSAGLDAVTPFSLRARAASLGSGLLAVAGCQAMARSDMEAVLSVPDHVRIVLLDDLRDGASLAA